MNKMELLTQFLGEYKLIDFVLATLLPYFVQKVKEVAGLEGWKVNLFAAFIAVLMTLFRLFVTGQLTYGNVNWHNFIYVFPLVWGGAEVIYRQWIKGQDNVIKFENLDWDKEEVEEL